jgi:glycine/D-amino acid oxidase-like deaminating enzyme
VAIVGGGYTGLWTALELRRRAPALDVVLLEADECGAGPSGRNGGFVHGYWASLATTLPLLGRDGAVALARAGEAVVPGIRAFCEEHGADVWLRESGMLMVSAAPAQDRAVADAVAAARAVAAEEQAQPLTPGEVQARCASPAFRGGVLFPDGATLHPGFLVRALRSAALAAGVRIHERTAVLRVRDGSVETPDGVVRARDVVLAAGGAMARTRGVSGRMTNFASYVVLTEPAPDALEAIRWTGGEAIVDGRMFLHYFRTTNDGRVLMGSGSGPIAFGARVDDGLDRPTAARAEAGLRRLLPQLAGVRIERAWGGPIDVAADHLPFVGSRGRVHHAAGYSGHGVGPSWLAGKSLASLVLDAEDEWTRLPLVTRSPARLPPEPLRYAGGALVRRAILACERAEERGSRPSAAARAVAAVPRLLGLELGTR